MGMLLPFIARADIERRVVMIATIIILPIVLAYTSWIYRVMRGPVTSGYIDANRDTSY
jgi:cytochrome d ubiquinol oxidase subunit II